MKKIFSFLTLLLFAGSMMAADFVKVTSAPTDWKGEYLLVGLNNGATAYYAFTGVDAAPGSAEVTCSNDSIKNYTGVTISVVENGENYALRVNGGDNDGKYMTSGSSAPSYSNALKFVADSSNHPVGLAMNGTNVVLSQTTSSGDVTIRFNYASDNLRFRFYKSGQQPVMLFKKVEATTPTPAYDCAWDSKEFLGNGSGDAANTNRYKFCSETASVVNIQQPGFATAAGIYITLPAEAGAITACSLAEGQYDIQGGGMIAHLAAFEAQEYTEFTITGAVGSVHNVTIYNANPVAPTYNYYLVGTLAENGWDNAQAMPMAGDSIVRAMAAGTYEFQVLTTLGSSEGALNYDYVDPECSSENVEDGGADDHNIKVTLASAGEVKLKVVGGYICVTGDFVIPAPAGPAAELLYTLDATKDAAKGSNNVYANEGTVNYDNLEWAAQGNLTYAPWRIGGKSLDKVDRVVYTKAPWHEALDSVCLTLGAASGCTVNSVKLVYSTAADFANADTLTVAGAGANKHVAIAPAEGRFPADAYYKFILNITITNTSNKYVEFKKVEFWGVPSTDPEVKAASMLDLGVKWGTADGAFEKATTISTKNLTEDVVLTWKKGGVFTAAAAAEANTYTIAATATATGKLQDTLVFAANGVSAEMIVRAGYAKVQNDGLTLATALTADEAVLVAAQFAENGMTADSAYIRGVVDSVNVVRTTNAVFFFKGEEAANVFECYNTSFTNSIDTIIVGDTVTVKSKIRLYGTTAEDNYGKIVARVAPLANYTVTLTINGQSDEVGEEDLFMSGYGAEFDNELVEGENTLVEGTQIMLMAACESEDRYVVITVNGDTIELDATYSWTSQPLAGDMAIVVTFAEVPVYLNDYIVTLTVNGQSDEEDAEDIFMSGYGEEFDNELVEGENILQEGMLIMLMAACESEDRFVVVTVNGDTIEFNAEYSWTSQPIADDMAIVVTFAEKPALVAASFEDITVGEDSLFRSATPTVGGEQAWKSGDYTFYTGISEYSGVCYYSNSVVSAKKLTDFVADYSAGFDMKSTAGGAAVGNNYVVWYNDYSNADDHVDLPRRVVVSGMYVTNNTYLENSIMNGDGYAKKFAQGDWFLLTVTGYDDGESVGTVEFYLADYRTAGDWKYAKNWMWLDLSSLGRVDQLSFALTSSDNGDYGMNTPAYFCFDELGAEAPASAGEYTHVDEPTVDPTALDNIDAATAVKVIRNGQVYILRNGVLFTTTGQVVE